MKVLAREPIFSSGEPRMDVKVLTKYDEFREKWAKLIQT
jgi:hypothetical protein